MPIEFLIALQHVLQASSDFIYANLWPLAILLAVGTWLVAGGLWKTLRGPRRK